MGANQPQGQSKPITLSTSPLYVETNFYKRAEDLRTQFEQKISAAQSNGGLTPFGYAFDPDKFQCLMASAERIFARDVLEDLMKQLCSWASGSLGASHASTPQARVYINGCKRSLLRDDTSARWHYALSITRNVGRRRSAVVKIVTETRPGKRAQEFRIDRVLSVELQFNQLLVHQSNNPYAVEVGKASMNPLDGAVLLDGYMW
jgi:hypothetical protein